MFDRYNTINGDDVRKAVNQFERLMKNVNKPLTKFDILVYMTEYVSSIKDCT